MSNKYFLNRFNSDVITIRKSIQYFPKILSLYVNLRKLPDVLTREFDIKKFISLLANTSQIVKSDSKNLSWIIPIKPEMLFSLALPTIKLVSFVEFNVLRKFVKLTWEYPGLANEQLLKNHSDNIQLLYENLPLTPKLLAVSNEPIIQLSVKEFLDRLLSQIDNSNSLSFTFVLKSYFQTPMFNNPIIFKAYIKTRSQQLANIKKQITEIYSDTIQTYTNLNVYLGIFDFNNSES